MLSTNLPELLPDMKTISAEFYKQLTDTYPTLKKNKTHARLMGHVLFSPFRCHVTEEPIVPAKLLAKFAGVNYTNAFSAKEVLEDFSNNVMPLQYKDWSWHNASARSIISYALNDKLIAAYKNEILTPKKDRPVILETGEVVTPKVKTRVAKEQYTEAMESVRNNSIPDSAAVAEYMNNLPTNIFTDLINNLPQAVETAITLPEASSMYNLNVLNTVVNLSAKPLYATSVAGNTVRLFPVNSSLAALTKDVRRQYLKGCIEIDIQHAHFSINSALWHMPRVMQYLKVCGDIWKDLVDFIGGSDQFEAAKSELKVIVYSIFYGASLSRVKKLANERFAMLGIKDGGSKLFKHAVIVEVMQAREEQLLRIESCGGAYDVYGRFIAVSDTCNTKSVLSQLAQAVELKIMKSVVDMAKKTKEFKIVAWLHDGCTIKCMNKEVEAKWSKRITDMIAETGASIQCPVTASVKYL